MSAQIPATEHDEAPFTVAVARGDHWGLAAKSCLEGVAAAAPAANLGILYVTETFGGDLPSILTFLRETTRIRAWVGGVAPGILGAGEEVMEGGGLAVMVGNLPPDSFRFFSALDVVGMRDRLGRAEGHTDSRLALIHGDPRNPGLPALIEAAASGGDFLVGGTMSALGPPAQLADTVLSGGLSGLILSPDIAALTGKSQGCTLLGRPHMVTEAWEGVIMGLDGREALEVLKDEAGELIARDLRRAAGYIHVGLPVPGADNGDYMVRNLVGIDPRQGWLAIGDRIEVGTRLHFVRRDANAAQADMARMLADIRRRLDGRRVRAAIYVSCVARGRHMFGADGNETAMIREALGEDVPLIGFFANGEISRDRLYAYTGVLAVLPEDQA